MAQKMITVCECDRCGREEPFAKIGTRRRPENWTLVMKMDLCPECTQGFSDWVELGKHSTHSEKVTSA